jgi:hypothetical protein
MHSDHLPIITTINIKTKLKAMTTDKRTVTNYKKANWTNFTAEIEELLSNSEEPTNPHTANQILTNIILAADKKHVPKGRKPTKNLSLPTEIINKIKIRDKLRKANRQNLRLKELNNEITVDIRKHKNNLWQQKLNENWDHKTNSHILWQTFNKLANRKTFTQPNRTITFKNEPEKNPQNTAECFNNQFTNLTKHKTSKINRQIDKEIRKLPMDSTTVTPTEVQNAIKNSKTNNSSGPDNISIHHLKHLGPTAITYLTKLYNLVLKDNTIPQIWKLSKVIPIPKPNKDPNLGSSYRPISLLSPLAKTLEKSYYLK